MIAPRYYRIVEFAQPPQDLLQTLMISEQSNVHESRKLEGFNKPRVWTIMNNLAAQTKSINLGQGFPSWDPPHFFKAFLDQALQTSHHQYCRAFGSVNYLESIKKFHKDIFDSVNVEKQIVTTNGGSQALYCCIMGLVNEGEEVVIFDPAYDVYRPQVQMAGGKTVGVQLRPRKRHSKEELRARFANGPIESTEEDEWDFDWDEFEGALNEKTKMIIITTPHNPVGKVFTQSELSKMAQILRKYPHIIILEDNVYQGMTYDNLLGQPLPKIIKDKSLTDRTLSVYSGGKIFQATGVRCGWVIGPQNLIRKAQSVHQYTCFSQYNIIENGIRKSLNLISEPGNTYLLDYAKTMIERRNMLIKVLVESAFDFDVWVPKGSHFVIADISRIAVNEKYSLDAEGKPRTKDYAFAYQLAQQNGVICIPCSPFYDQSRITQQAQNYVRFAFCKSEAQILQAGKRMNRAIGENQ